LSNDLWTGGPTNSWCGPPPDESRRVNVRAALEAFLDPQMKRALGRNSLKRGRARNRPTSKGSELEKGLQAAETALANYEKKHDADSIDTCLAALS